MKARASFLEGVSYTVGAILVVAFLFKLTGRVMLIVSFANKGRWDLVEEYVLGFVRGFTFLLVVAVVIFYCHARFTSKDRRIMYRFGRFVGKILSACKRRK